MRSVSKTRSSRSTTRRRSRRGADRERPHYRDSAHRKPSAAAGARRLSRMHPGLTLEVIAEPRNLSVMRREADIALRHARPREDRQAITRRIGNLDYAVYGPTASDARRLSWIAYEADMAALPHAAWIDRAVGRQGQPASLVVNDSELALNAVKAGIGKSLLPCLIADREPGLRRLAERRRSSVAKCGCSSVRARSALQGSRRRPPGSKASSARCGSGRRREPSRHG